MAEVKINNISELESYGNNIKDFSDKYEVETNALYRNFTDNCLLGGPRNTGRFFQSGIHTLQR